ncbi:ABC transporter permease [Sphingobacterium sp. SRCM116780]|uniref:ABC transporter permease n=1 Tax=Sphingobacterium sp. SRCM116780 TaxID=2907623 RepID=UPI001F184889|nr:ABC transporter permease [Sphingobacterium sp. SRCM116780]UIR55118.1 ABC transporter permease [Sphingobacterium sp. SRCM116780]
MIKNYLKIAWRNLWKNKGYSSINIIGLAIGLACCLLIVLYIHDELSYDQYHVNKDRIYRVVHSWEEKGQTKREDVWGVAPIGPALQADFPEVEKVVQFSGQVSISFKNKEKVFQEERVFFMNSTAFDVFSWKTIIGNSSTALNEPYSAVLTKSAAKKYFGDENPIGKTLEGGLAAGRADPGLYKITAVIEDVPSNSHFTFDVLLSMRTFEQTRADIFDSWGYVDFYTYLLVSDQFNLADFNKKIPQFLKQHNASQEGRYNFHLEPLRDAYLHSTAGRQPGVTGSVQNLYIFAIIGLFILFIACVNFMNLATSRSMERAKEVGVRKAIGANHRNLILQFMCESLALVFISALLALLFVVILLPFMEAFAGKQLAWTSLFNWTSLTVFLGIVTLTGIIAASYPAFILASFKPVEVLKGTFKSVAGGQFLRKGLVVFQFGLSIVLIAGTCIVFSQLHHLQHTDLGFQQNQMLTIDYNFDDQVNKNLESIKNSLSKEKDVIAVSSSRSVPGTFFPNAGTDIESREGKMVPLAPGLFEVDIDFIPNMGMKMIAGRAYSRDFPADTAHSLIINEAAAKLWGYTNPQEIIGKRFNQWGREGQIIGVVKDFNYLSLHNKVEALALRLDPSSGRYITIKLQKANQSETIAKIQKLWSRLAPNIPFNYSFLDESFDRQYEADYRFRRIFTTFSGFALFIACLGLLGLITYTAQQRTKEIGIRKVLGASIFGIIQLLSIDFIKLVLIAICIATPIAYWAMNKWLDNFAYHIDMQWWMFATAGMSALFIALVTVSYQALKAARANPVNSLRDQ